MNLEYYISKKIFSNNKGFSKPIVNIAILGISLGIAVMILTLAIVSGFQKEIREKVISFGSHIQITSYDNNDSYEGSPINREQTFLSELSKNQGIRHIQCFATKAGIIKTKTELQGVVVKGIGSDFDWDFFKKNIISGTPLTISDSAKSDKILISKYQSEKLKLNLNDTIIVYFIQNQQQRARRFSICGIYETGLGEMFDQIYVIADIAHIQKLNGWDAGSIAGFEIIINDYKKIDEVTEFVNETIGYDFLARSIKEVNRPIFSWLDAQDINAVVVISLMALVSAINMISALLVLILERTNMIGILKALGMSNWGVRKIFLYNSSFLILKGMIIGNIAGLAFCLLQKQFHLVSLDEATYYLSSIPIHLNILHVLFLNITTFTLCMISLILPSYIITYISPIKAMKFA
jgi:lipoprotein-releasing system permease protein